VKLIKPITIIKNIIKKRPLTSFLVALGLLLLFIVLGSIIRKPKQEVTQAEKTVKPVRVHTIGTAPKMTFQGKIEKSGVITIVAQSAGVVKNISIQEGQYVNKKAPLIQLSTSYSGGNIAGIQAQLAKTQYQFTKDNKQAQKDIIQKQKEAAEKTEENATELRAITERSVSETRDQLGLSESILNTVGKNLRTLETATNSAENQALILSTKQLKSQFLGVTNQLRSALRQSEYQAGSENPPAELAVLQKDIAIKQLELQEKTLDLNEEVSKLNYQISAVSASLMSPSTPIAGLVERVFVRKGQFVSAGTPLVSITGESTEFKLIVPVSEQVSSRISKLETSKIHLPSGTIEDNPHHVTSEPVNGGQHQVIYYLPSIAESAAEGSYVSVEIPIGYADTSGAVVSIPLDAVHQLQDKAFVYIVDGNKAISREVKLGVVYGRFVEITSGIVSGDKVILNRSVNEGDLVSME